MSGLSRAVDWTQRIGYSYPTDVFQAALKATFPRLTDTEVRHCFAEYQREQAEWTQRVETTRDFWQEPESQARVWTSTTS